MRLLLLLLATATIGASDEYSIKPRAIASLGESLEIRADAASWVNLIVTTKPTFVWQGRFMAWIETDEKGKPTFTLDQAFILQPEGSVKRWVLVGWKENGPFDDAARSLQGAHVRGVAPLTDKKPVHDTGPGTYAIQLANHPDRGRLYEVGWESGPTGSGNWIQGKRLYFLQNEKGRWDFLGEGPTETSGKCGGSQGFLRKIATTVDWPERGRHPCRLRFVITNETYPLGEIEPGRYIPPVQKACHDVSLDVWNRVTPSSGTYIIVEEGQTWGDIVLAQIGWETCLAFKQESAIAKTRTALAEAYGELLKRANHAVDPTSLEVGQRISLPINRSWQMLRDQVLGNHPLPTVVPPAITPSPVKGDLKPAP